MDVAPESAPPKRLDRLSALISHLRVEARLVEAGDASDLQPNFMIFRNAAGKVRLVFCPSRTGSADPSTSGLRDALGDTVGRKGISSAAAIAGAGLAKGLGACTGGVAMPAEDETVLVAAHIELAGVGPHLVLALPSCLSIGLEEAPDLASVVQPLTQEVVTPRCGGLAVFLRLCEVVVIRLLRHAMERGRANAGLLAGLAHPRLAYALVAIHDNPARSWSLEDLAQVAGMSRTQFAVTFREVLGVTPGGYLSDWRLSLARIALQRGEPVKTVSRNCGFSSSASFSRAFSRRFGQSPSRARQLGDKQNAAS